METGQLRTLRAVVNRLSFNRADHLRYVQSSISARVRAIEEELGARLLHYGGKIASLADEIRDEAAEAREPQGSLHVRIPETFGAYRLSPVIKEFHLRFPGIKMQLITCAHEGLEKNLRKGVTDPALLLAESIQAVDLMVEALGFEPLLPVTCLEHLLAARSFNSSLIIYALLIGVRRR